MSINAENLSFLKLLVDKSWDEVLIADLKTKSIIYANQTASQNLQLNGSGSGTSLDLLFDKDQLQKFANDFSQPENLIDNSTEYELRMRRLDKSSYPARVKCQCHKDGENIFLLLNCTDITEKQKTERQLSYLANYDSLTGLPNRHLFFEHLKTAMSNADRNENLVALLYLDLDGFKGINERYGHELGDNLVREVGKRLTRSVRRSDTVSRLGGDEFTIILSNIKHVSGVDVVIEKILNNIKMPFVLNGSEIVTAASIGVSLYPFNESSDCYELLRQADAAMYHAKEHGRLSYHYYSSDLSLAELRRSKMEAALQMALLRNEFKIFYQPRVSLRDGKITGAEALLRWTNPDLGFVSPVEFIPVLESMGMISEVGQWVLESGCRQLRVWNDKGFDIRLSINVSAHQFANGNFANVLENAINESQIKPQSLEMEITEGVLIGNHEEASSILYDIKNKGVHISLDDFGTGYSSLSYLKKFPIDILKIDRSFVMDLMHSNDSSIIVETIIGLAKNLKLQVTAEGIEELDHVNFLLARECEEGQGYFYGKPMPDFEFEQMLIEQSRIQ